MPTYLLDLVTDVNVTAETSSLFETVKMPDLGLDLKMKTLNASIVQQIINSALKLVVGDHG